MRVHRTVAYRGNASVKVHRTIAHRGNASVKVHRTVAYRGNGILRIPIQGAGVGMSKTRHPKPIFTLNFASVRVQRGIFRLHTGTLDKGREVQKGLHTG